jgi:hypothetical protein
VSDERLLEIVSALKARGGNISATAKHFGLSRQTIQQHLTTADDRGLIGDTVRKGPNQSILGRRVFADVVRHRKAEFEAVKDGGTFRTPHKVRLPDDKPFCLVLLGDPHLDNPGTDLNLWDRWIGVLNRKQGVYGICLGDYLDNWFRALGHLYGGAQTTVDDAWTLLEGYIDQMGENLLVSVSGNHDDWGEVQALRMLMERNGVIHRRRGIRLDLRTPAGHSVTVGLRHRFTGHSQWNPAHAVTKAAQLGWKDDILAGGDKHISGKGYVRDPDSGRITHCYQVAAFKLFDEYAEEKGFLDKHISPAVALVIDPTRPQTDPGRVVEFLDPVAAAAYVAALRAQPKTKGRAKARRM